MFVAKMDVSDRNEISTVCLASVKSLGEVNILINNAGLVQGRAFHEMSESLASKQMVVNAESHFWLCKEFLPTMQRRKQGQIVSIASVAGLAGTAGLVDYCAGKFAAVGFMEALRLEQKHYETRVKCLTICPYFFNSGMFLGVRADNSIACLMETEQVANRTIKAILQHEEGEVVIPWRMGATIRVAKLIVPTAVYDFISYILVGFESILNPDFKGRQGPNAPILKTKKANVEAKNDV